MASSTRPLVCVVGASYGGLSAALGFARRGVRVVVAEAAPSVSQWQSTVPCNQHLGLWSPALQILDDVYDVSVCELPKACVGTSSYRAYNSSVRLAEPALRLDAFCKPAAEFSFVNRSHTVPSPSLCFFQERNLRTALLAKCEQSPNIEIFFGAALRGTSQTAAAVSFEGEAANAVNDYLETCPVKLVVGADGKHSMIRRHFWKEPKGGWLQPRGYSVFRGFTPYQGLSYAEFREAFQAWGPDTRFAAVPAPGGVAWFLAAGPTSLKAAGGASEPGVQFKENLLTCRRVAASWQDDVQEILANAEPHVSHSIVEASPTEFSAIAPMSDTTSAPIALVGDAANTLDPILAQGAGVAIEQGYALSQCASQRLHLGQINDVNADLMQYDVWQKRRCRRLRQISNAAQQFGQLRTLFMCQGRTMLLGALPRQLKSFVFDSMIRASLKPNVRLE